MPETSVLQTPQTIPDAAQPVQGIPGSRATFFLRSTPKVFTVISAGQSNQDFVIASPGAPASNFGRVDLGLALGRTTSGRRTQFGSSTLALSLSRTTSGIANPIEQGGAVSLSLNTVLVTGATSIVGFGLYESLLSQDRPLAWWGLDGQHPQADEGHFGFDLSVASGGPLASSTLLPRGEGSESGCRNFNGSSDAYYTPGTLLTAPTVPPPFHAATANAGTTTTTTLYSPNYVQAGDLEVACLVHATPTATISTAASGWTLMTSGSNATCAYAFYKRLPVADESPTAHTWTWSASGQSLGVFGVYHGCDPDVFGLVSASALSSSTGTSHETSLVTHPDYSHSVVFWCADTTATITPAASGLKSRASVSAGTVKIVMAEYDQEKAGSIYRAATTDVSADLGAFILTFGAPDQILDDKLDALAEKVTLHALINPDVVTGTRTIIRKRNSWGLQLSGSTLQFVYSDGDGLERTVSGPTTVSASTTSQVIVSDDGTDIHFWLNGAHTSAARVGAAGYTTSSAAVVIGAHYLGALEFTHFFDGKLDEVAVFGGPFSTDMAAAYWQAYDLGTFGDFLQPVNASDPEYPRGKLEVAWTSSPTDDTPVWEDATSDLRADGGITVRRGRNFELDRIESGQMDFTLSNRDRKYDPAYTDSPLYPYVTPTRAVRFRAQADVDQPVRSIFFGYTEGHPLIYPHLGLDAVARFSAIDSFKALALDKVSGALVRPQELSGSRLDALLDGFPGIPFTGDAGQSEVSGDDLNGVNALDHAQQVAETEGGVLFVSSDGVVTFQDRHFRSTSGRSTSAVYGVDGWKIRDITPLIDEARLFTAAAVTPASGRVQLAFDVDQAAQHFLRTKVVTTLHASDNDALAMAEVFAYRYATPRVRIPSIVAIPAGHSSDRRGNWAAVLEHEISDRVRTREQPIGDTTIVERDHFIEGITHSISRSEWTVSLSVSPSELEGEYWLVGSGQVGQESGLTSTRLGW